MKPLDAAAGCTNTVVFMGLYTIFELHLVICLSYLGPFGTLSYYKCGLGYWTGNDIMPSGFYGH